MEEFRGGMPGTAGTGPDRTTGVRTSGLRGAMSVIRLAGLLMACGGLIELASRGGRVLSVCTLPGVRLGRGIALLGMVMSARGVKPRFME